VAVLELLLPERCAVCRRPGPALCEPCRDAFVRLSPPVCERCGSPSSWPVRRCAECAGRRLAFARARCAIVYDERARALVRSWKENGRRRLAEEAAALLAEVVAAPALWTMPVEDLLRRTRTQKRQRGLSLADRRRNVRGTVAARGDSPRRVCLVDDVYTSGATADACASALRKAGARHVEVVTLARAVR
jgi:predicted amidophosphoribosyltransferase